MGNFNRFGGNNRSGGRDSGRHNTFGPRDNSNRLMMYPAVCDDCGKNCEVPFKPTGNREIFCSDCFEKRGGKDSLPVRSEERNYNRYERDDRAPRNDGYERNDRNERPNSNYDRNERSSDREMFSAICDDCGKDCQLPFKPSSSKPVYCSRCFEARGEKSGLRDKPDFNRNQSSRPDEGSRNKEIGELKAQIISMNVKLDKVMKALNIASEKVADSVTETKTDSVKAEKVVKSIKSEVPTIKINGAKSKVAKKAKKAIEATIEIAPKKKIAKKVITKKRLDSNFDCNY
jgi:CxxC-x17-CxxC domain-containing protein